MVISAIDDKMFSWSLSYPFAYQQTPNAIFCSEPTHRASQEVPDPLGKFGTTQRSALVERSARQSPISIVDPIQSLWCQPSNPIQVRCKVFGGICKLRLIVLA
jgi:hypothetical protein